MTDFLDCIRPADEGECNTVIRYPSGERRCERPAGHLGAHGPVTIIPAAATCKIDTWCTRREHPADQPCEVVPRRDIGRTDFGPRRAVKVGWG